MKRIYLSSEEKRILRELRRGNDSVPAGMDNFSFVDAVITLHDKGFIKAVVNYEEVLDMKLTVKGYAYMNSNPGLANPVDWTKVAAIAACVAAVAVTLALFISCCHIM